MKMQLNKKWRFWIPALIFVFSALPIFTFYLPERGDVHLIVSRLQELADEGLRFFPTISVAEEYQYGIEVLHSNVFYFLPALVLRLTHNLNVTWFFFALSVQLISFLSAALFFRELCSEESGFLCGLLLYMTFPVRTYIFYDRMDIAQTVAWMLIPLYAFAVTKILRRKKGIIYAGAAAVLLALIACSSVPHFMIVFGITMLIGVVKMDVIVFPSALAGAVLAIPALKRTLQFLQGVEFGGVNISLSSIMPHGYSVAQLFHGFELSDGFPGLGWGICFALGLLFWYSFAYRKELLEKNDRQILILGVLLLVVSLQFFPWDYAMRVHPALLKLVALLRTPAIFLQYACFALTIPAAKAMQSLLKEMERKEGLFVMAILAFLALSTAVYQENTLVYLTLPLLPFK